MKLIVSFILCNLFSKSIRRIVSLSNSLVLDSKSFCRRVFSFVKSYGERKKIIHKNTTTTFDVFHFSPFKVNTLFSLFAFFKSEIAWLYLDCRSENRLLYDFKSFSACANSALTLLNLKYKKWPISRMVKHFQSKRKAHNMNCGMQIED